MKKILLYAFPIIPIVFLYAMLIVAHGEKTEKTEAQNLDSKMSELSNKVSKIENAMGAHHRPSTSINTNNGMRLTRSQLEHLVKNKGCKIITQKGQNILACPKPKFAGNFI